MLDAKCVEAGLRDVCFHRETLWAVEKVLLIPQMGYQHYISKA